MSRSRIVTELGLSEHEIREKWAKAAPSPAHPQPSPQPSPGPLRSGRFCQHSLALSSFLQSACGSHRCHIRPWPYIVSFLFRLRPARTTSDRLPPEWPAAPEVLLQWFSAPHAGQTWSMTMPCQLLSATDKRSGTSSLTARPRRPVPGTGTCFAEHTWRRFVALPCARQPAPRSSS